jgi:hypothetical protein
MVTNNFEYKSFMESMRRLSMHSRGAQFFSLGRGGVEERDFLFFPCSQSVPIVFPWDSQFVHQNVSKSTSDLSHMVSTLIYLWSKVVCFAFVSYLWDPLNPDASDLVLNVFGKLSTRRGAWAWFHGIWTCSAKVLESWILNDFFTIN